MSDELSEPGARPSTTRTEAFSDGVFAIAATLLVLDIHLPSQHAIREAGGLLGALLALWPSYVSYVAAFLTIGAVWVGHHQTFRNIAVVDRTILGVNLLLLMFVSLVPFPTALVAEHLTDGPFSADARTATAAYALLGIGCTVSWILMWIHLHRRPGLLKGLPPGDSTRKEIRRSAYGVLAYLVSLGAALVLPGVALLVFIAAPTLYVVTARGLSGSGARARNASPAERTV